MCSLRTNPEFTEKSLGNPEKFANQMLSQSGQEFPPTNLDRVILSVGGIDVIRDRIDADGYLLEFGPESAEILVKSSSSPHRQRFTIAHELAHLIVSRRLNETGRSMSQHEIERWCNEFAASLLMPTKWIRGLIGSFEELGKSRILLTGHVKFDVSCDAFYRRMHEVFEISVLEITSDHRLRTWPVLGTTEASEMGKTLFKRTRLWSDLIRAKQDEPADRKSRVIGPFRADSTDLHMLRLAPRTRWVYVILTPAAHDRDGNRPTLKV